MALIQCSECGRAVSDRATVCPHCGNPIAEKENLVSVASKTNENAPTEGNIGAMTETGAENGLPQSSKTTEHSVGEKILLCICGGIFALIGVALMSGYLLAGGILLAIGIGFFVIAFSKKYGKAILKVYGIGILLIFIWALYVGIFNSGTDKIKSIGGQSWTFTYEEDNLGMLPKDKYKATITIKVSQVAGKEWLEMSYSGSDILAFEPSSTLSFSDKNMSYSETKDGIDYYSTYCPGEYGTYKWGISSDKKTLYYFCGDTLVFTR